MANTITGQTEQANVNDVRIPFWVWNTGATGNILDRYGVGRIIQILTNRPADGNLKVDESVSMSEVIWNTDLITFQGLRARLNRVIETGAVKVTRIGDKSVTIVGHPVTLGWIYDPTMTDGTMVVA